MAQIVNYMEKLVFNKLDEMLKKHPESCGCERCRMDMAAIALNNLTPRYIVTNKGSIYAKLDMLEAQFSVDIMTAVSKGIKIVTENPKHDSE